MPCDIEPKELDEAEQVIVATDVGNNRQTDKQMVRAEVHQPHLCHVSCHASDKLVNEMTHYFFEGGNYAFGCGESEYRRAPSSTGG